MYNKEAKRLYGIMLKGKSFKSNSLWNICCNYLSGQSLTGYLLLLQMDVTIRNTKLSKLNSMCRMLQL